MSIPLQVCTGPECSNLGSAEIMQFIRRLPAAKRKQLDLRIQQCFSRCQQPGALCPCVRVAGDWIVQANRRKLEEKLEPLWEEAGDEDDPFAKYS
jgi:NADH:ubiquinone oxidoreductase subunit E